MSTETILSDCRAVSVLFLFFNLKIIKNLVVIYGNALSLPEIYVKRVLFIMKQLYFYELVGCGEMEYLQNWVNWTGEVPEKGDTVLIHFSVFEEEYKYRVVCRVIDGSKPDDIDIIVRKD